MIPFTFEAFFLYCFLAWGTNMLLNVLGIIKKFAPEAKNFDKPIDGGLSWGKDRLIGESTTYAGLVVAIILSIALYIFSVSLAWSSIPLLVYLGHMAGSIIKRRMHKKGGEFMPFVDHGDYMILTGGILVLTHYLDLSMALLALLITYIIHPLACFAAFKFNLRDYPH